MKKSAVIRIVIWSVVAVLLLGVLLGTMIFNKDSFSTVINLADNKIYRYDNENEYSVGNMNSVSEQFDTIKIDWVNGGVNVISYDGDTVKIEETSTDDIEEKYELRWRIKANVLTVKPCKSTLEWSLANKIPEKELYIYIPEDLASNMNKIEIDTASAGISVIGITATEFDTSTASGDTWLEKCSAMNINIENVSGYVNLTEINAENIDAETVSGNVEIMGTVKDITAESVSGIILLCTDNAPQTADISTVSGDVRFEIPDNDGFNIELDSVSGKITSDFPLTINSGNQTYGNGSRNYNIETVSGNVNIKIIE